MNTPPNQVPDPDRPRDPATGKPPPPKAYERPTMPWERGPEMDQGRLGLATAGLEFALVVGAFLAAGWWVDEKWGIAPWGKVVLSLLGVATGMYLLIRQVLRGEAAEARREAAEEEDRP